MIFLPAFGVEKDLLWQGNVQSVLFIWFAPLVPKIETDKSVKASQ